MHLVTCYYPWFIAVCVEEGFSQSCITFGFKVTSPAFKHCQRRCRNLCREILFLIWCWWNVRRNWICSDSYSCFKECDGLGAGMWVSLTHTSFLQAPSWFGSVERKMLRCHKTEVKHTMGTSTWPCFVFVKGNGCCRAAVSHVVNANFPPVESWDSGTAWDANQLNKTTAACYLGLQKYFSFKWCTSNWKIKLRVCNAPHYCTVLYSTYWCMLKLSRYVRML